MDKKIVGTCVDYTYDGKGVVKKDNRVIFVDGVIVGEEIELDIVYSSKNQTLGKLTKILKESPETFEKSKIFFLFLDARTIFFIIIQKVPPQNL